MRRVKFEERTAEEIAAARAERSLVYVPIGSLEFHGCHLPVGLDTMHAHAFCVAVAEKTGGVVLPPTYWGTQGHEGWEGSMLLKEDVVVALMRNVVEVLAAMGYEWIIIVTGHHPDVQGVLLREMAEEWMAEAKAEGKAEGKAKAKVLVMDPFAVQPIEPVLDHGGLVETSLMLHLRGDLVDMARLRTKEDAFKGVAESCVDATRKEGKVRFEGSVERLAAKVEEVVGKG